MPSPSSTSAPTLTELFHSLQQDGRVGSRHISTYLALLQCRERHIHALVQRHEAGSSTSPASPTSQGRPTLAPSGRPEPPAPVPTGPNSRAANPASPAPPVTPSAQTRPFYIYRDEVMRLAKIQGRNTYYRIMSELDAWGYIEYWPSRRSKGATKVFLPSP